MSEVKVACPQCGTEFVRGQEPWGKRKLHCTKHDMIYTEGNECPACLGEKSAHTVVPFGAGKLTADELEQNDIVVKYGKPDPLVNGQLPRETALEAAIRKAQAGR